MIHQPYRKSTEEAEPEEEPQGSAAINFIRSSLGHPHLRDPAEVSPAQATKLIVAFA
jgi:hypothetical protein